MRLSHLAIPALALAASVSTASAHGVWLAERWGDLGIIYGHGAEDSPYDPAKLKRLEAIDATGRPVSIEAKPESSFVRALASDEAAAIVIDFDNGIYSKAPDGTWVNKPKSQVPGATEAGDNKKYNVSVLHLDGDVPPLPAQALQIVPLSNPTALEAGRSLRIRVLFQGRPLPGAKIRPDYVNISETTVGETDVDGEATVVVRNDGLNVIAVSHDVPLANNPDADKINHFATLGFVTGSHVEE